MTHYSAKDLGRIVRIHRQEKELTQQELATKMNISRANLIALENGNDRVALGTFLSAVAILNINILAGEDAVQRQIKAPTNDVGVSNDTVLAHIFPLNHTVPPKPRMP